MMNLLRLGSSAASAPTGAERSRDIKRWTHELLALSETATVVVTESRCTEPGCPPLEVIISVFEPRRPRRECRIHAALAAINLDAVRSAWQDPLTLEHHSHD